MSPRFLPAAGLALLALAADPAAARAPLPDSAKTASAPAPAQGVVTPNDGDAFSKLTAQAEAGDPRTDFRALRFAWLDSAARKRSGDIAARSDVMWKAAEAKDHAKVKSAAEAVISIQYSDLDSHMLRREACTALKDEACADHEHFIEFGLIKSILDSGDGKAPATAWHVASVAEEYFVMRIAQVQPKQQDLVEQNGRTYDHLTVATADGQEKSMWFDITDFFKKELG
jgi:hypothetical protein